MDAQTSTSPSNDPSTSTAAIAAPGFTLDAPVTVTGTTVIEAGIRITLRRPGSGELRGLHVSALLNGDVSELLALAPRISTPPIPKGADLDPADLTQLAGEVVDFLLPKAAKAALPTT